jgi:hypothetical protein
MQAETRDSAMTELTEGMYADLPNRSPTPAAAYEQLITGTTETANQAHDIRFPGFATEIHGVHIQPDGAYRIPCLPTER